MNRKIFHLLVCFLNECNVQGCDRSLTWDPMRIPGIQTFDSSCAAFPHAIIRELDCNRVMGHELEPIEDVDIAGINFTCNATKIKKVYT